MIERVQMKFSGRTSSPHHAQLDAAYFALIREGVPSLPALPKHSAKGLLCLSGLYGPF